MSFIWALSFIRLVNCFLNLFTFSKKLTLVSLIFYHLFSLYFIYFHSILYCSFFILILGFFCSFLVSFGVKLDCFWIFVCSFVSWCKPVLLWISFSELLLLHSINFGMLYFCSHFSLDIFKFLHWYHWWPIFSSAMCCIISMFLCISHFLLVIDF